MPKQALLLVGILTIVWLGAPRPAEGRSKKSWAKKHFKRGEDHYNAGTFRGALQAYQKAYKAYAYPAFLFNIAQCYRQLKEYTKAGFFYRLFLSKKPRASNREEVQRRIAEMARMEARAKLEKSQGRLSIVSDPKGATLHVDNLKGPPRDTSPVTLTLRGGAHVVLIQKKGYLAVTRSVTIQPGKLTVIKVKLVPLASSRSRATVYAPMHRRWWFWSGIGAAVVAGALASYFGTTAQKAHRDYLKSGNQATKDRAVRWALATDLTLAGGAGVLIATTVAAIIVYRRWKRARKEAPAVTVAPSCGARSCGVWVTGSF